MPSITVTGKRTFFQKYIQHPLKRFFKNLIKNPNKRFVKNDKPDFRTSGDQTSSSGINIAYGSDTRSNSRKLLDTEANIIDAVEAFREVLGKDVIPGLGNAITFAQVDPSKGLLNGTYPMDYLTFPGAGMIGRELVDQWDKGQLKAEMNYASHSWDNMKEFAKKRNTNSNTIVIFVYAAMDVHQQTLDMINFKVPTSKIYNSAEDAKAALGFVPSVVYFKFIESGNSNLTIYPMNKVQFK